MATITPPTLEPVEEDIETETELVGEGEAGAEGEESSDGDSGEAAESSDESVEGHPLRPPRSSVFNLAQLRSIG